MKTFLTAEGLIKHMDVKGIQFTITSETEAYKFLTQHNYYMKLASYRRNYFKRESGASEGTYIDLEFAYLVELSTIDMHLRYLIVKMCLDIEHALKIKLLNLIEHNKLEDGYNLVEKFTSRNQNTYNRILRSSSSSYSKELILKHQNRFPIWAFLEVVSFGELAHLCNFYKEIYNVTIIDNKLLNNIRDIRNASAHSNCLIYDLNEKRSRFDKNQSQNYPINEVWNFIMSIENIGKTTRVKKMNNRFISDFVCLLYGYNKIIKSDSMKNHRYEEVSDLFNIRMLKNKDFFEQNDLIKSSYLFLIKVLDKLNE